MNEFVYGVRKRKEGRRNELRSVCWRQIMLMKSLCLFVCLFVCLFSKRFDESFTLSLFAHESPAFDPLHLRNPQSIHKIHSHSISPLISQAIAPFHHSNTRRTCSITRLLRISRFVCSNKQHKTTDQFNMDHFSPIQTIISFF